MEAALDVFAELVTREAAKGEKDGTTAVYTALMAACEKVPHWALPSQSLMHAAQAASTSPLLGLQRGQQSSHTVAIPSVRKKPHVGHRMTVHVNRWQAGQWELAVALFEKLSDSGVAPDVPIFNSMIAACAHGGGFARARALFDAMPAHGCRPDAVTFANLIRAYKKGGQWCAAMRLLRVDHMGWWLWPLLNCACSLLEPSRNLDLRELPMSQLPKRRRRNLVAAGLRAFAWVDAVAAVPPSIDSACAHERS